MIFPEEVFSVAVARPLLFLSAQVTPIVFVSVITVTILLFKYMLFIFMKRKLFYSREQQVFQYPFQ